jgi:ABC-type multidrug transport system fused ATPase/permease subunit
VLVAYWLRLLIDASKDSDLVAAVASSVTLAAFAALGMLMGWAGARLILPLGEHTGHYIDRRLCEITSEFPELDAQDDPEYLDRLEVLRDYRQVLSGAGATIAGGVETGVQLLLTGALLATIHPALLVLPAFAIASLWTAKRAEAVRQRALDLAAANMRRGRHFFEIATSAGASKEMRVFGLEDEVLCRHRKEWLAVDRRLDRAAAVGLLTTLVGWLVFAAGYLAAMFFVTRLAVAGRASLGQVVLAAILLGQANNQVAQAAGTVNALAQMTELAQRYLWIAEYRTPTTLPIDSVPVPSRIERSIDFRSVSFRYPGREAYALRDVDLTILAGSTVALVGENGAGKSTFVKLLCRLYAPSSGAIEVDGIQLDSFDVSEWRAQTTGAFQDFVRFELLAGETVGVGDLPFVHDVSVVCDALDRADAKTLVDSMPEKLETPLGRSFDEGIEPSFGQWQRLALARGMMRASPLLLVLDEPTASLDPETEYHLYSKFLKLARRVASRNGGITILVSHRLGTVRMADLIVVLDAGKVREVGTHADLIASKGLYAELFELQASGYR